MSTSKTQINDFVQVTAVRMNGETIAQFEFSAVGTGSAMRREIAVLGKIDTATYDISLMVGETPLGDKQILSEVCVQPKQEVTVSVVVQEALRIKSWTNFVTSEDYELCFGIKVHGIAQEDGENYWGSIVHFTDCNDDEGSYGSRIPRIFIGPGGTALCINCGHTQNWMDGFHTEDLTCEREYNVRVRCEGQKMEVFFNNELAITNRGRLASKKTTVEITYETANGDRPSRAVEVHFGGSRAGGEFKETANASIRELTYVNLRDNQRHQLSNSAWVNLSEFKGEASFTI